MRFTPATLVCSSLAMTVGSGLVNATDPDRQSEVAARGAQVMSFTLQAATHVFTKTPNGGLQQVVVKDAHDTRQIGLVRKHLKDIAGRFGAGDFAAPTDIHGQDMPGLAELKKAKPGEIAVRCKNLTDGGQIEYSTRNASLIAAIHRWFDAQLADHGPDAIEGHEHNHMMNH